MTLSRGRGRDRAGPADRAADPADPGRSWATSARPTAAFALTPRVLELGVAYVRSHGAVGRRPAAPGAAGGAHGRVLLDRPARRLGHRLRRPGGRAEDRRAAVQIGTRFPALPTSLGKVLLAALPADELDRVLAEPSRSGLSPRWQPDRAERDAELREVRARGWALTDEQLAPGHPVGGRAAARRRGPGGRGRQRQRARRRDLGGAAGRGAPAAAAAGRRATSAPTSPGSRAVPAA